MVVMKAKISSAQSSSTVVSFDPQRAKARYDGAMAHAGVDPKKQARAQRRAKADVMAPIAAAERLGASLPEMATLFRASWRVELVDVPVGEMFKEAMPAYVVRFDGNSPLERLRRSGVLDTGQVSAGARFVGCWLAAVKSPKLTASYEGVIAQGGQAPAPWIDQSTDAWKRLRAACGALLPIEFEIVRDVTVFETPIEDMARRGVVRVKKLPRATGAIVQALSSGLQRLSGYWGLDGGP